MRALQPAADPTVSARLAGLRYVSDDTPGISRRRNGRGFTFHRADGSRVRDPATLKRIAALVIPPAWQRVWISPDPHGHLQATGRDARGRKQYRYHPDWTSARDDVKYGRMIAFGRALPAIRRRTEADLRKPALSRERVLATVVRLLEKTLIRVGNEEYARTNGSFGLTTLQDRHVAVRGARVQFRFRAKSGVQQAIDLEDAVLARSVKKCQDLPGQTLFQYVDADGGRQRVDSGDVNEYLRSVAGQEFTAKDFRTWAGTVLAATALHELGRVSSSAARKRHIVQAVERVAKRLGNTKAVCRRCYVHPAVFDSYLDGVTIDVVASRARRMMSNGSGRLSRIEAAVLALLQQRLARDTKARRPKAA
jgi:DNA topoisomerase-1